MHADALFWDNLAEDYAAKPVDDPDAFARKIAITKALMRPEHTVLDIGCGTGSLALILRDSAAEVHGLDLSSGMIAIANRKKQADGVDNVHFHVGPFDRTFQAFAPGSLDGICAYSLLHLVEDRHAALAQIYEMLKPGGFFVSSTVCLRESWVPYGPMIAAMRLLGKAPRVVQSVSKATVAAEIEAAGFVELEQPDVGAEATIGFMVARKPA